MYVEKEIMKYVTNRINSLSNVQGLGSSRIIRSVAGRRPLQTSFQCRPVGWCP